MNLGMEVANHNAFMIKEKSREDTVRWLDVCAPAKPQLTYKSPLQRIGEALRTQQHGSTTSFALDSGLLRGTDGVNLDSQPSVIQRNPQSPFRDESQTCVSHNYPYRRLPGGTDSTDLSFIHPSSEAISGKALKMADEDGNATISSPATRAAAASRNKGFLGGTGLLSSLFSNPRTRAPFKPQKANRGTSSWQLKQYAEATLGSGSLRKAVRLPEGEDKDEWLAVNGELLIFSCLKAC